MQLRTMGRLAATAALFTGLMTSTALADATLVSTLTDVRDVNGASEFVMQYVRRTDSSYMSYAITALDGTQLSDPIYNGSGYYEDGVTTLSLAADGRNLTGAVNEHGEVIIPFEYGDIKVRNPNWALAFVLEPATADNYDYTSTSKETPYLLVANVDIYHIADGQAALMASIPRANFVDYYTYGDCINIQDRSNDVVTAYDGQWNVIGTELRSVYDDSLATYPLSTFRGNGQYGLMDADGNVVMEPAFQTIYSFYGDYAVVSDGAHEGLIDSQGNVVVPVEYDKVKSSYNRPTTSESSAVMCGYAAVIKDGKVGFVDVTTGQLSCQPKYAEAAVEIYGCSAIVSDATGTQILVAADGVETVLEGYTKIRDLSYGSGYYYRATDADDNSWLIDWHGQVVIPQAYGSISLTGDGVHDVCETYDRDSTTDIYELTYPGVAIDPLTGAAGQAQAVVEAPAQDEPAVEQPAEPEPAAEPDQGGQRSSGGSFFSSLSSGEADQAATPDAEPASQVADAPETPEPAAAGADLSQVATLIDSALTLLDADADANAAAATELVKSALTMLGDANPAVATLLQSVIDTYGGFTIDTDMMISLLQSAKILLG